MARPKIYDNEQVLGSAMFRFWHHGYEATGMRDLEKATGLKSSSLYHNFGNKEELFLQVLDFYIENVIGTRIRKHLSHENPVDGIHEFFTSCFTDLPKGTNGIACLMVNTVAELAGKNDNINARLRVWERKFRKEFVLTIGRAKSLGQISENIDSAILANQLILALNGLLLSSKVVKNRRQMVAACEESLSFLMGNSGIQFAPAKKV